jgi:O-antigen/teichoic acid export membrane protein
VSVGKRAARGAIWTVGASTGTRVIGLIGTLYMTRLLRPEDGAYFGPRVVGFYNMAYNLADIPAVQLLRRALKRGE